MHFKFLSCVLLAFASFGCAGAVPAARIGAVIPQLTRRAGRRDPKLMLLSRRSLRGAKAAPDKRP
jgi:hypothetical protein